MGHINECAKQIPMKVVVRGHISGKCDHHAVEEMETTREKAGNLINVICRNAAIGTVHILMHLLKREIKLWKQRGKANFIINSSGRQNAAGIWEKS